MTRVEWQRKRARSRYSAEWQVVHKAAGLCRLCSKPLAAGSIAHCADHLLKIRLRMRTKAKGNAWRRGGPGRPPLEVKA
jgi:hypothetical protein